MRSALRPQHPICREEWKMPVQKQPSGAASLTQQRLRCLHAGKIQPVVGRLRLRSWLSFADPSFC